MTPRREMALALGLVAVGAVVALVGSGRSGSTPGVPAAPGTDTGTAAPAALALAGLAGAGAALLVRSRTRVVLGLVLVVVAGGLVAAGLSPTRWAAMTGGVLVALGALVMVVRARGWPQPRARYETPSRGPTGTPRDAWDALDRGEDPTI